MKEKAVEKSDEKKQKQVATKGKTASGGEKRPHHLRLGMVPVCEIWTYQKSTDLLVRRLLFQRLVCETTQNCRTDLHFDSSATMALQEEGEALWWGCLSRLICVLYIPTESL